jgi:hypothetical protein
VLYLVAQSPTELRRKLDTLARGTATHGFTREQLETALRLKEERKAAKDAAAAQRKAEEDAHLYSPLMPTDPAGK